ncbi:pilin [Candidatus Saccharibacteria bacterium]|nr:pilin [Candidatus Saccharibacteria bacterium]
MNDIGLKLWIMLTNVAASTAPATDASSALKQANVPHTNANTALTNILNLAYFAAGIACTVMIVVAGINWIISSGQPDKVKKAQQTLTYAIIGLIIVVSAFAITRFIVGGAS